MDTTTSLKMTSLAIQSLFSFVEEDNLAAVKAHLDKFRDVDSRSDVSPEPIPFNLFIQLINSITEIPIDLAFFKGHGIRKHTKFRLFLLNLPPLLTFCYNCETNSHLIPLPPEKSAFYLPLIE